MGIQEEREERDGEDKQELKSRVEQCRHRFNQNLELLAIADDPKFQRWFTKFMYAERDRVSVQLETAEPHELVGVQWNTKLLKRLLNWNILLEDENKDLSEEIKNYVAMLSGDDGADLPVN